MAYWRETTEILLSCSALAQVRPPARCLEEPLYAEFHGPGARLLAQPTKFQPESLDAAATQAANDHDLAGFSTRLGFLRTSQVRFPALVTSFFCASPSGYAQGR
jgi:hypothetical protein